MIIIIFAFIICLGIPFDVAWDAPLVNTSWYIFLNQLALILFVIDILITFRTSIILPTGEEIVFSKNIAISYIFSLKFYLDVVCILNIHLISGSNELKLL